jgi:phosphoglycolate phosphatase-like HAD superfamily hydrolase
MNQYRHLSAYPENFDVLQALKARGVPTAILSNGDPEMLAVAVRSAGFAELIDPVLSVHEVRRYKTDPGRLRAGAAGAEAAGAPDPLRVEQRLGRDRRDLVRLHDAVGEPPGHAARAAGHPTDPHRHEPA